MVVLPAAPAEVRGGGYEVKVSLQCTGRLEGPFRSLVKQIKVTLSDNHLDGYFLKKDKTKLCYFCC